MKTPDGDDMTVAAATLPVGSALRIAPRFVATAVNEDSGIETGVEAEYDPDEGRYVVRTVVARALRRGVREEDLRYVATQAIVQAAVPQCIALRLSEDDDAPWTTVADLTTNDGRIIPQWMATYVAKRGVKAERHEVIEILYGVSALAGNPPVKTIELELDVVHRTASDWIAKARAAGFLKGMKYHAGRQADG